MEDLKPNDIYVNFDKKNLVCLELVTQGMHSVFKVIPEDVSVDFEEEQVSSYDNNGIRIATENKINKAKIKLEFTAIPFQNEYGDRILYMTYEQCCHERRNEDEMS